MLVDLTESEVKDLWYGKCLRLADNQGRFDEAVKGMSMMTDADELKAYHEKLEITEAH